MTRTISARRTSAKRAGVAVALVVLGGVAGCARDEDVPSATIASVPATTVPATTVPPTTAPTSTTSTAPANTAPATTPPAPATTAPTTTPVTTAPPITVADLVLRRDGIGPFTFGEPEAVVVAGLTALLGAPSSVAPVQYPVAVDGGYTDEAGDYRFDYPAGNSVCFVNRLCTEFGGPDVEGRTFVGWTQGDADDSLATVDGVTVGSRWSEFPTAMDVGPGGCYSSGFGMTDGIDMALLSEGVPFGDASSDGSYVARLPDPTDVVVVAMLTGEIPGDVYNDC